MTKAPEAASAALDVLLTDATDGQRRFVRPGAAVSVAAGLARRPRRAAHRVGHLGAELGRVASGRSEVRPAKRDRRFADPAWQSNWLFRRLLQTYLAAGETVDGLIADADAGWRAERQARFAAGNVFDAFAPSNFPWSNPTVIKASVDEGGANLVRGARRFAHDFPGLPATVDTSGFAVGENLGLTPGSVVLRTDVFELIQYKPQTAKVREVPLLFAPPTINKYYVLDLAPGRSLVEWLVQQGQQVFVISWRNPDAEQGHFDLDTYAAAVLEARDAVAAITRQPAAHLIGACSGGIIGASALGHLAADGRLGEIASLSLLVAALDNERAGTASALANREIAAAAVAESARRGYVDGRALEGVFTWLRPNDLVWSYVVNNYLLGKQPPAFDVLCQAIRRAYDPDDRPLGASNQHRDEGRHAHHDPAGPRARARLPYRQEFRCCRRNGAGMSMSSPEQSPAQRRTARIAGVWFVITFVASIPALLLYDPVLNDTGYILGAGADTRVQLGALLEIITAIAGIATAVVLFPIVKRQSESIALGYVATRVVESTMIVVGLISLLAVVTLREDLAGAGGSDPAVLETVGRSLVAIKDWTFLLGPAFCAGIGNGLLLGYLMYRSGLVPRRMALLGLIGGPVSVVGAIFVLFGAWEQTSSIQGILTLGEIAWEVSLGIYLIVKGFKPSPVLA